MHKKSIHRILALLMVAVFFFATTPHDFVHLFTGHKDTTDHYEPGRTDVSNIHIHCLFLQITIATYVAAQQLHVRPVEQRYLELSVAVLPGYDFRISHTSSLRGPPAAC